MKKIFLISLAVVLALAMVAVACPAQQEEEEEPRQEITLDFATFWPAGDFQAGVGHENWMNAITALVEARTPNDATGYTVKWIKTYSVPPGTLWTDVKAGTVDVITSGPGYTGGVMPLWEGPEYPAELPGRTHALPMSIALQSLYDGFTPLQDQVEAQGVQVMHYWSTGPGYFLMTEGYNVTSLLDFEALDKDIRAANPASVLTITALGADPGYMPMSAALEAFQAGLLSGILCPTDTPKGFGLGAYVRAGTFAPFSYQFVFMKVMNQATYDGLPAVVQEAIDDVNAVWPEYYGKLRTWGEADGLQYCFDEIEGFTMYYIEDADPTEYAAWVAACAGLITDWIGTDSTRQDLWDAFVAADAAAAAAYSYTPGATPPAPPTVAP